MTVTGSAYPADAVTGSPTYTALQGRNSFAAAMGGATSAKPLGGYTGVRPGTPSTTVTASSTTWGVGSFAGYIDLEATTTNSGYFFSVQANASGGTVTAAAASARVDLIYVQINDSNTGDGSSGAPRVTVDYQAGVAGAGVPALAASRAFVIAQINVPLSGGGSPTVTWVAPYTVAAGGILPVPTLAYPATPSLGQYVDDAALGLLRYNGSAWVSVSATPGSLAITPSGVTVTGGSGVINADGSVTVTGSATVVRVNGVFLAAYRETDCYVDIDGNNANVVVTYQFCASTTIETATQYNFAGSISAAGTVTGYSPGAQTSMHQGGNFARQFSRTKLEVERANLAEITSVRLNSAVYAASAATPGDVHSAGGLNTVVQYDGLVINITGASSTATMKLRFVGIV